MNYRLAAGLVAAMLTGIGAAPQEGSDAKDLLKKGLETSAAEGGFTFTGTVEQESPFGGGAMVIGGPGFSVGPDGKCAGTLGSDGVVHVRLEKEKNVYELFRKGSKTVHRQVWSGRQLASGSFAGEASAALDLARLSKAASKSRDVKKDGEKKVGDVDCVAIKATLPSDIVESEESGEGPAGIEFKMFELNRVEATFYFGKDDHILRKAEYKFVKGFNSAVRMAGAGGDEDEDEDEDGGGGPVKASFSTTFNLTLGAFSKTASVTVPDDVKGLLKD